MMSRVRTRTRARAAVLTIAAAALAAVLLGGLPAGARADIKLGFIDSDRVLEGYSGTRVALETFDRDVNSWNQEAVTRKKELDDAQSALAAELPMLSDERRREREQDYQRKLTEYDQFIQNVWGPNGLVTRRNEEILQPIISKIQTVLAKIGSEEGYDLILDAADGNILYADQALDLTQRVIDALNQEQTP